MQTALDLLERQYEVHIVADACSSRSMTDRYVGHSLYVQGTCHVTEKRFTAAHSRQQVLRPSSESCTV